MSQQSRINMLSEQTANRIAAGEVVERPASVLKELLENALDAGATRITIDIEGAGSTLIRVADNGHGMSRQDLALCLERHATSKLKEVEDLEKVLSLGFRGEALPSIASVSRFTIRSRLHDAENGFQVQVEGGNKGPISEAGSPPGTLVEVRDLFYNIPARRKFLKAPATESGHLAATLLRLALAWPQVGFSYRINDHNLYQLPPDSDLRTRIGVALGREALEHMVEVAEQAGPLNISGMAALPSLSRAGADQVYLFINRRFVRDKVLLHAITQAYSDIMPHNRKPVAVLHIGLDPALVDVNVHPAKAEVRFRDSSIIHQALRRSLRNSLSQSSAFAPHGSMMNAGEAAGAGNDLAPNGADMISLVSDSAAGGWDQNYSPQPRQGNYGGAPRGYASSRAYSVKSAWPPGLAGASAANATSGQDSADGYDLTAIFGQKADLKPQPMFKPVAEVRVLAQMHGLYILASSPAGLLIIDQHAAYERLNYEELKSALRDGVAPGQPLLKPLPLNLGPQEYALAVEAAPAWLRLGLELVVFGPATLAVQAVPAHWAGQDPAPLLQQLLAEVALAEVDTPEFLEKSLSSMACKKSVLQGQHLSLPAMQDLLDRLFKLPPPLTCPHGRPVALGIDSRNLLRAFQRI